MTGYALYSGASEKYLPLYMQMDFCHDIAQQNILPTYDKLLLKINST
jgi:hypothetical protein